MGTVILPPFTFICNKVLDTSVQSLICVLLFVTPWTAARQSSLSITNFRSSPKLTVHQVGDAIQPSHLLSPPSPPARNPSQHQGHAKS